MGQSLDPQASLSPLPRADGSATYSYAGYTVTASVNGPIEAGRRDENPYEALVDVVVRPAAGVGGTRERHLESILEASLKQLVLTKNFPRCVIQIVLQIEATPENAYVNTKLVQAQINLPVIPALIQAAVLALLSAAVPLRATAASTIVAAVGGTGEVDLKPDPSPLELADARSLHVLAFTSDDGLLLAESEGDFGFDDWSRVYQLAYSICCKPGHGEDLATAMDTDTRPGPDLRHFVRATAKAKVEEDLTWKSAA